MPVKVPWYKNDLFIKAVTILVGSLFIRPFYTDNLQYGIAVVLCIYMSNISMTDVRTRIISNRNIITGYVMGLGLLILDTFGFGLGISITDKIIGFSIIPGVLILIDIIFYSIFKKPDVIGMGDIKLLSVLGLILGGRYQYLLFVFMLVIVMIHGLLIAMYKGIKFKIPLAPYIQAALIITLCFVGVVSK